MVASSKKIDSNYFEERRNVRRLRVDPYPPSMEGLITLI